MAGPRGEQPAEPMVVGDLSAAYLRAKVLDDEDGLFLQVDDEENAINIGADYGSVEQQILGVERLISAAQEYRDELRRRVLKAS